MLLGLMLAKQGIKVLVLEQHHDFHREYRGEVLMPRFAHLFDDLNLLEYMKGFPHTLLDRFEIRLPDRLLGGFPMRKLSPEYPYAFWMPQPVFLDALHQKTKEFPSFQLWFGASATELIKEGNQTVGLKVRRQDELNHVEEIDVRAKVIVGADGRTSRLRHQGDFKLVVDEYKFDVLWFSLPRPEDFPPAVQMLYTNGRPYVVAPKHPDLIQCGMLIKPGELSEFRKQGLDELKRLLSTGPPAFKKFAEELQDLKPFFPLQARIERVDQWAQDGLVLIGDAAHTCSPIGGIGVSIAVETAAVAAHVIDDCIQKSDFSAQALGEIQRRREPEVKTVQDMQHNMGGLFQVANPVVKTILPWVILLAVKLGFPQLALRRVLTSKSHPITIDPKFRF